MKRIIYSMPTGVAAVVVPVLAGRLMVAVGKTAYDPPITADTLKIFRDATRLAEADAAGLITWAETEDEWLARIRGKDVPAEATDIAVVEHDTIPADRTFREAWVCAGKGIEHDMEKCRAIWRDRLRAARAPLLSALDVDYQRADEAGDAAAKKAVADQKQVLRDVTADPAIDAAATPGELKAAWPTVLAAIDADAVLVP